MSSSSSKRVNDAGEVQLSRPSLLSGLNRPSLGSRATAGDGCGHNAPTSSSSSGGGGGGGGGSGGSGGGSTSNDIRAEFGETLVIPPRPRRLWKVSDTKIPMIPPFFPMPLNPRLVAYVADASPSVVAVRIAESLRRQSIAVEYDDETVTATCMTVDRCHFMIYLWQAKAPSQNSTAIMLAAIQSSSSSTSNLHSQPGILVEFRRISGDVIIFHTMVSSIKKAAKSHGTGQDERKPLFTSPLEYPRFVAAGKNAPSDECPDPNEPSEEALDALEHAVNLLRKDRLDAQLRGMEEVVCLTDVVTSGLDVAFTSCLAVIGAPLDGCDAATTLHQDIIYHFLVDRDEIPDMPGLPEREEAQRDSALAFVCGFGGEHDIDNLNDREIEQMRRERVRMCDEYHGGLLRSMALRIFANALSLLVKHNPKLLYTTLSTHGAAFLSEELMGALWNDVAGASRPPGIVAGTRLASPHEAAIACRCIRLLGQAHPKAKARLARHKRNALEQLEKCYFIGQANHELLEYEAKRTYRFLNANT